MVVPGDEGPRFSLHLGSQSFPRCEMRFAPSALFAAANEVVLLIEIRRARRRPKKADHHFVVRLISPAHRRFRVRIVRIVFRVVVPSNGLPGKRGARSERARLGETIAQLPEEIPMDAEQRFDLAVRLNDVVLELLAAQMHVRKEAKDGTSHRSAAVTTRASTR